MTTPTKNSSTRTTSSLEAYGPMPSSGPSPPLSLPAPVAHGTIPMVPVQKSIHLSLKDTGWLSDIIWEVLPLVP